jgi:short-subunit dehydrogenase
MSLQSALDNKVIWITGASSGIGEALTYALSKKNVKLIISARREDELKRVKENCAPAVQSNIRILPLDLSKGDMLESTTNHAIQLFGHVDILINNAGIGQRSLIQETPLSLDRQIMEINYFGTIALTKHLLRHFITRQEGHYVTVSSLTGKFGTPYRSSYAASKHALHGFFDALRAEHAKDNVRVTMICPGFIQTGLRTNAPAVGHKLQESLLTTSYKRRSAEWCAKKIIRSIEKNREEVYIGGKEVLGVYLKRFFPSFFSRIIRKVAIR